MKTCPQCEESDIRTVWTASRKLREECASCSWAGEPRIPEARPVLTEKRVSLGGVWRYEVFDQYGYPAVYSRGFNSETECREEAERDRARHSTWEGYGVCVAVVWPPETVVRGELLRGV